MGAENALRFLGFNEDADKLKAKSDKEQEDYFKKYGERIVVEE